MKQQIFGSCLSLKLSVKFNYCSKSVEEREGKRYISHLQK